HLRFVAAQGVDDQYAAVVSKAPAARSLGTGVGADLVRVRRLYVRQMRFPVCDGDGPLRRLTEVAIAEELDGANGGCSHHLVVRMFRWNRAAVQARCAQHSCLVAVLGET